MLPSSITTATPAAGTSDEPWIFASRVVWYPDNESVPTRAHAAAFTPYLFMIIPPIMYLWLLFMGQECAYTIHSMRT